MTTGASYSIIVDAAAEHWGGPTAASGGSRRTAALRPPRVMCWAALHRGIMLAEECLRKAPIKRWEKTKNHIREAVEAEG